MTFFSKLLGITYPWQKYSQIVVHDFVSGAMENVTAVVHGTNMHQDPGTYIDDNYEHISHTNYFIIGWEHGYVSFMEQRYIE